MDVRSPDVSSDPVGVVVKLVCAVEPALSPSAVEDVVLALTQRRATRLRLAQALSDRPGLLTDGRSPAPRVAGELLVALKLAGATRISLPCCHACGKHLRTFKWQGENWLCSVCGTRPVVCGSCGKTRQFRSRDRAGKPLCYACPPDVDLDPVQVVIDVVAAVDPGVSAETVTAAVAAVTPRPGQRRRLAWALSDRPELLTGAGAEAAVPSVLRLIEVLCEKGATGIVRPACPRCGLVVALKMAAGVRICRRCSVSKRAEPCVRCGALRPPTIRDENGPVCANCLSADLDYQEICIGCGRRRPVHTRSGGGPRCESCRLRTTMTCSICGRLTICAISKATGEPWCHLCKGRRARCSACGRMRPVRGGKACAPLCATCTRPDPSFWLSCPTCGEKGQLRTGPCAGCVLRGRLRELLGDGTGAIRLELQALYENLANYEPTATVLAWLTKSAVVTLRELGTGERQLTHAALDALPDSRALRNLRCVLVATGALPVRDEQLVRLEASIARAVDRDRPDERQVLQRYAVWHLLRRLRQRVGKTTGVTRQQATVVQDNIRAAIALLDWLAGRGLSLGSAGQGDLEAWLASPGRRQAGSFVRWAAREKLTTVEYPTVRWQGPSGVIDTESRWEQARWLLSDDSLRTEDRVAGLLVLLYAQRIVPITRFTLAQVETNKDDVLLRLGAEPIVLPAPLGALVMELVADRRGQSAIGNEGTSTWLFPGGQPGRPISPEYMGQRLRRLGLHPGQARSTALFQLATDLPAAVLAQMLGIQIGVAVTWQRACGGDWASYAANYSRRHKGD